MQRRNFLAATVAASAMAGAGAQGTREGETMSKEVYELRLYHLRRGPAVARFHDFARDAWVPAYNRAGRKPVGVFEVAVGPGSPTVYMLIPHSSMESVAATEERIGGDEEFHRAGATFINLPAADPPFVRGESSVMVAFDAMPKLETPALGAGRIFELRTYESHSRKANKKKIEMFNSGEIPIFRRAGLAPVFFGETIVGPRLPQLTYMIGFENPAARERAWAAFIADPEWKKLSAMPGYTDFEIVSVINNALLRPTAYSQI